MSKLGASLSRYDFLSPPYDLSRQFQESFLAPFWRCLDLYHISRGRKRGNEEKGEKVSFEIASVTDPLICKEEPSISENNYCYGIYSGVYCAKPEEEKGRV